jgi:hypothetical protein
MELARDEGAIDPPPPPSVEEPAVEAEMAEPADGSLRWAEGAKVGVLPPGGEARSSTQSSAAPPSLPAASSAESSSSPRTLRTTSPDGQRTLVGRCAGRPPLGGEIGADEDGPLLAALAVKVDGRGGARAAAAGLT